MVDAHIANVGSEHFPGGYFPIPYTLTSPDAESFPQLPPLREPLEAALFGKWDQPGNPHLVWRIDATRVNFALTRGVLSRFCCAVMGRYPTTLAVELKLSQVTLEAFNKTLKLCTAAASKEFVNVLDLQEMPPQGLDPEEQWLWVDPVKKSGWTHRTATDAVVRYQTVKVQAWDAVAPTEFSTNRRLRTHIPDITYPTLYSTDAPFTMLGMGCPHPSFHNSYPVANHDIPNPPIVTEEGFAAAGYRQYDRIIPEDLWAIHKLARQVASWRAKSRLGARQLGSWRAPTSQLARAKSGLGAPTCELARQLVNLREPRPGKPTLGLLYRVGVFSAREGHETRVFSG